MENRTTIYTATQNKSLANLLNEAKKEGNKPTTSDKITKVLSVFFFLNALLMICLLPIEYAKQVATCKAFGMGFEVIAAPYIVLSLISVFICFTTLKIILKK